MSKAIRVLVANRPKLMRDLVVSILADQSDMELVGEVSEDNEAEISTRIRDTAADLVVIALDDPQQRPELCARVLQQYPDMAVIAVAERTNRCVCYWTVANIEARDVEMSEVGFLTAVRKMAELRRADDEYRTC
jgi:DNA-binding NarL/FixJ family response regulator